MNYESFQIVTNGEKFQIRVSVKYLNGTCIACIPKGGCWFGCVGPVGPSLQFDSRKEAVDYIKKEFGEVGYRKLLESWNPC